MANCKSWILDFDETLASSGITWGLKYAFPKLINDHQLPVDAVRFEQAVLIAQERGSYQFNPAPILHELFDTMGWPFDLEAPLLHSIFTNYRPELYDDVIPFLEQLHQNEHKIYVVSNNPISPKHIEMLDLGKYITAVLTPRLYPQSQPKPHRSLWDQIVSSYPEINDCATIIVGDDPWSDGIFAENCGLPCWIIDRMNRFGALQQQKSYHLVQSLLEIPISET